MNTGGSGRRRGNTGANAEGAEVTQKSQKGIPKLFGKGWKQCLCGLQGINGWEGAWGLLVGVLVLFGLRGLRASWFNPASYQSHSQQSPAAIRPPSAPLPKPVIPAQAGIHASRPTPAFIPPSSPPPIVIPAQAGIQGCASYCNGFPPARE